VGAPAVRIVGLEREHLPALVRFSLRTWRRPASLEFCRWRYLEAPYHKAHVALRGEECLGFLSVFSRPYRLGKQALSCLETADWYCLPELRLSGIGIRLMRRVMEEPAPIFAVGGSPDTLRLLPRLGWQRLGETSEFDLVLRARAVGTAYGASGVKEAGRALGAWLTRRRPRRPPAPPRCEAVRVEGFPRLEPLYAGRLCCDTVPLPMSDQLAWLAREVPGARRFAALDFRRDGATFGWSLLRLERSGDREASLLELFAPEADAPSLSWMVGEAVALAADSGASRIRAQTSCPGVQAALREARFAERARWPVHAWRALQAAAPGSLHFCLNTGDAALLPYSSGPVSRAGSAA
jgi:hypothetical protein